MSWINKVLDAWFTDDKQFQAFDFMTTGKAQFAAGDG